MSEQVEALERLEKTIRTTGRPKNLESLTSITKKVTFFQPYCCFVMEKNVPETLCIAKGCGETGGHKRPNRSIMTIIPIGFNWAGVLHMESSIGILGGLINVFICGTTNYLGEIRYRSLPEDPIRLMPSRNRGGGKTQKPCKQSTNNRQSKTGAAGRTCSHRQGIDD